VAPASEIASNLEEDHFFSFKGIGVSSPRTTKSYHYPNNNMIYMDDT
jgi:hypothetical protein